METDWQSQGSLERVVAFVTSAAKKCDLPTPPKAAQRAMQLTQDPRARTEDVVRVVGSDGALAAQVLRISRSATYLGQREPPRTLLDAIRTVGFKTVRQVVVVAALRSVCLVDDPVGRGMWEHALATALAADELGQLAGEPRGGAPFIAGLLHDIGMLAFYLSDRVGFTHLARSDRELEEKLFGATHASVGAYLAQQWGLESAVVQMISQHHDVAPGTPGLEGRLATADWIAHRTDHGGIPPDPEPVDVAADLPPDIGDVIERVSKSFEAERAFFG
jgi:putative nucleotidyltransferase with HDIG domain